MIATVRLWLRRFFWTVLTLGFILAINIVITQAPPWWWAWVLLLLVAGSVAWGRMEEAWKDL